MISKQSESMHVDKTITIELPKKCRNTISHDESKSNRRIPSEITITTGRYLWSVCIILVSWFSILSFPLPIVVPNSETFQIFFYLSDAIFLVDILLRLIFPTVRFHARQNVWSRIDQQEGLSGLRSYLCTPSAFAVDVVSIFPFELVTTSATSEATWFLRSNRLFRLFRFSHLWNVVSKYRWEHHYYDSIHQRRMWLLFFTMAVCAHFAGIFFVLVALQSTAGGTAELIPGFGDTTWAERDGLWSITNNCSDAFGHVAQVNTTQVICYQSSPFARYFRSVYWSVITMVCSCYRYHGLE